MLEYLTPNTFGLVIVHPKGSSSPYLWFFVPKNLKSYNREYLDPLGQCSSLRLKEHRAFDFVIAIGVGCELCLMQAKSIGAHFRLSLSLSKCMYVCMYIYVCMYVCVSVCMYVCLHM